MRSDFSFLSRIFPTDVYPRRIFYPPGFSFICTFDSWPLSCYNDCRKSLGGRNNEKIHHRRKDRLALWACRGLLPYRRGGRAGARIRANLNMGTAAPPLSQGASSCAVRQPADQRWIEFLAIPENRATIVSAYRSQVFDLRASTAALRLFSGKPLNSFILLY